MRYLRLLLPLVCVAFARLPAADTPPNIVLIMADDMGFSDIGCYGSEIATPNIDRLGREGVKFRQFYNASRCCPTRASVLTGLYSHQAGIGDMVNNLGRPAYQGYLNDHCATIAEVLKQRGYMTGISGKWHVGERQPHWPGDRGFDRTFSLISGASDYFEREPGRQWIRDGKPFNAPNRDFYLTDGFTDYAKQFVREAVGQKKPFFLYLAYNAPHWPLHARDEDIAKYAGRYQGGWDALRAQRFARQRELGVIAPSWDLAPRDPEVKAWDDFAAKDEYARRMAVYAAQIDRMDQGVGAVLAELEKAGVADNTVIFFLSDNGGCHEVIEKSKAPGAKENPSAPTGTRESYRSYGRGWANASNTPFRMFKHWVHEGGISTPLIVRWPGKVKQTGGWTDQIGHVIDLMPTCLDIAGATYPKELNGHALTPLEGRSLVPALRDGAPVAHDYLYWEHEGNRAVRHGPWKLVAVAGHPWELYNIDQDRSELHDLSGSKPDIVADLNQHWTAWAAHVGVADYNQLRRGGNTGE